MRLAFLSSRANLTRARSFLCCINLQASGLAAGKGVILPVNLGEAVDAVTQIMVGKVFGAEAGAEVVVEEFLEGEEVSVLAFSDGANVVVMPPAQVASNWARHSSFVYL